MMEQRSPEWFKAKLGKASASRIKDVMATIKSGESAARRNYRAQLICERLTGTQQDSYTNGAMQWGIDNEASARTCYEFLTDTDVVEVGFIDHPTVAMSGASPDGLVGDDGMVEIKCPNTATHIDWLLSGGIPSEHVLQMQWQMACCGRKWCDFVSYDPRLPAEMQIFTRRLERDDKLITEIEASVVEFLATVDETIDKLQAATREAA